MKLFRTKQKSRDETSVQQMTQNADAKDSEKQSRGERREKTTSEIYSQSTTDSADEEKREQMRKKIQESINAQMAERKKKEEEVAKQEAMFYNKLGMTPLSVLAAIGNLDEIKLFIEKGTDLNLGCTCDGSTPLMLAAQNKHKDVVEFLLKNGADCTTNNNEGNNAFMIAVRTGDAQIINIMWPFRGSLQINHANLTGFTALHIAAERKWECCVQFLLANGADPNLQTNTGLTPLMQCAMKGDPKTAERLIQAGADILKEDMNGNTAICWSLHEAKEEALDFLLSSLDQHKRDMFVKGRIAKMNSSVENDNFDCVENILFPLILRLAKKDGFRDSLYNQKIIYNIMNVMHAHVPVLRDPREIRDADYLTMVVYIMCHLMFHKAHVVEERFVSQFIRLKGPEFFMETAKLCEVTWKFHDRDPIIYFMPIIYLIEVPEGRKYLMQNCCRVSEFSNRFRLKIDTDSWRHTNECVNLKFAEMWERFCDYFGKLQSSQREQKMAELLEEEEREKQKKDKKRDKKKRKKQRVIQEQNGEYKSYGEQHNEIDDTMASVLSVHYSNQQKERKKYHGFHQNTKFIENLHLPNPSTKGISSNKSVSQTSHNTLYGVAVETLKLNSQHSNDVTNAYTNSSTDKFHLSNTNSVESEALKKKKKRTKKKMSDETNAKKSTNIVAAVSNKVKLGPMQAFPDYDDAEQTWVTVHTKKHLPKTITQDNNADTDKINKKAKQRGKKKVPKQQHSTSQNEAFSWAEVAKGKYSKPIENSMTTPDSPPKPDLNYEEEFPTLVNHKCKEMGSVESSHRLLAMETSSDTCHHSYADVVREEDPEMASCSDSNTDPMESGSSKQGSPLTTAVSDDSIVSAKDPEQANQEVDDGNDGNDDIACDGVHSIPVDSNYFRFHHKEDLTERSRNDALQDISQMIPDAPNCLYNSKFHPQQDLDISTIHLLSFNSSEPQETTQKIEITPDQTKPSALPSAGHGCPSVHPRLIGIRSRSRQTVPKEDNKKSPRNSIKDGIFGKEAGALLNSGSTQNLALPSPSRSHSGHTSTNLREEVITTTPVVTSNGWLGTNTIPQDLYTPMFRYEDMHNTLSPTLVRTPFHDMLETFENKTHFQQDFTRISNCYDDDQPQVVRSCGDTRNELLLQDVHNQYENTMFNKADNVNMTVCYARTTDVAPCTTDVILQPTGSAPFHNHAGYVHPEILDLSGGHLTNVVEHTGSNWNQVSDISFPSNPHIQTIQYTISSPAQSLGYFRDTTPTSRDRPEVEDPSVMDCSIEGSKPISSKWNSLNRFGAKSSYHHENILPSVEALCAPNSGVGFRDDRSQSCFGKTTSSPEDLFHTANPNFLDNCTEMQTPNVLESRYDDYGSLDNSLNEKAVMGKSPFKTSSLGQSILFNACQIDTTEETVFYPSDLDNVETPSLQKVCSVFSKNNDHEKVSIKFFPSFHEETNVENETNEVSLSHKIQQVLLMQLKSYYDSLQVPDSRLPLVYDNNFYYYASCTGVDMKQICQFIGAREDEEDTVLKFMRPNAEKGNIITDMKYGHVDTKTLFEKEYGRLSKSRADIFAMYDEFVKKNSTIAETGPHHMRHFVMNGEWQPKSKRWAEKLRIIRNLPAANLQRFGDILLPATDKDNYIIYQGTYPVSLGFLVNGTEVAVKVVDTRSVRVSRSRLERLLNISGSNFILQYLALAYHEGTIYLAMELYEYNLEEHMRALCRDQGEDALSGNKLVWQFLRGVAFLHEQCQLVHGDLKPENVVVDTTGKLKISGYGLCKESENNTMINQGTSKKDRCWLAPEVFLGETHHTFKSDIHVSAMLIYYILTGGKHPYGSTPYDIQINLGRKICQLFYINEEANHMLSAMLPPSPFDRPSVSEVFKHPYFWADEKKLRFVLIAGSDVLRDLKAGVPITGGSGETMIDIISAVTSDSSLSNWIPEMDPLIMKEMRIFRQYKNTPVELVLFVYNCCLHFEKMAPAARDMIDEPCKYFLNRFPTLFMTVYRAIRASGRTEKTCYKPFF
ncbi:hypothetical protein ACJMK2_010889 [Sinanodonta woodiana]|uniref:Uncharacterized protein n=1 Tax=Sinanodonta woodiana TaxID=1069815 RepID=A0ABD3VGW4_SINWO